MACLDFSWLHWIKTFLPTPRGSKEDRSYSPTFASGPDIELEYPPPVLLQNTIGTRPNRKASVYQSPQPGEDIDLEPPFALFQDAFVSGIPNQRPQLISTSHNHSPSRSSDDIIVLPSGSSDNILLYPVTSFNRTKPLKPLPKSQR